MGQVEFEGKTKPEKTAGVWVDGQYVGYVNELKGDKKVLLLPGNTRFRCGRRATSTPTSKSSPSRGRKRFSR